MKGERNNPRTKTVGRTGTETVVPQILDEAKPYSTFQEFTNYPSSNHTYTLISNLFSNSTTGFEVRRGGAKAVDYPRFPAETEEAYSSRRLISEMACAYEHDFKPMETQRQVQMCSRCGGVTTYA